MKEKNTKKEQINDIALNFNYEAIEKKIGYSFKNKALLLKWMMKFN